MHDCEFFLSRVEELLKKRYINSESLWKTYSFMSEFFRTISSELLENDVKFPINVRDLWIYFISCLMYYVVINIMSTHDSLFKILHIVIYMYRYIYGGFSSKAKDCLLDKTSSVTFIRNISS